MDLTSDSLAFENVDLLICRDLMGHLSLNNIDRSIRNILNMRPKWTALTHFRLEKRENIEMVNGGWRAIDMMAAPFNFPQPDFSIFEFGDSAKTRSEDVYKKSLSFWKTENLLQYLEQNQSLKVA